MRPQQQRIIVAIGLVVIATCLISLLRQSATVVVIFSNHEKAIDWSVQVQSHHKNNNNNNNNKNNNRNNNKNNRNENKNNNHLRLSSLQKLHRQRQQQQQWQQKQQQWQQRQRPATNQTQQHRHHEIPHFIQALTNPLVANDKEQFNYSCATRLSRRSKVMYFLHLHKSAGSTFCELAFQSQLITQRPNNCNVQADQHCCGNKDTLQAQIIFAQHTTYDFVANEQDMYEHMAPEYYIYVTILRNSLQRYYSHYNHLRSSRGLSAVGTFTQWYSRQPDNWNVRKICGPKCSTNIAKFQINSTMFQYTLQRLNLFSDILFVETFQNDYPKFATKYKWKQTLEKTKPLNVKKDKSKNITKIYESKWDWSMSALDDALYEFAKYKMKIQQQQQQHDNNFTNAKKTTTTTTSSQSFTIINITDNWLNEIPFSNKTQWNLLDYFENGKKRNCTNVCCHEESCSLYR